MEGTPDLNTIEVVTGPDVQRERPEVLDAQAGCVDLGFRSQEGTVGGEDSTFFYLPPDRHGTAGPVLGAGDMFVMFNDRPEVRAMLEFLATPEAGTGVDRAPGGFVSPNKSVPVEWYKNYKDSRSGQTMVAEATTWGSTPRY